MNGEKSRKNKNIVDWGKDEEKRGKDRGFLIKRIGDYISKYSPSSVRL